MRAWYPLAVTEIVGIWDFGEGKKIKKHRKEMMPNESQSTISIEIVCNLTGNQESGDLMDALYKKGITPKAVRIALPKVIFKSEFKGSFDQFLDTYKTILQR